ncbi:MAG: dihydrouridine synthase [Desulfobacterales bacterium]|nr:MAG: dihydrouridine synthase [Desulfobacterales bacterium]
MSSLKNALTVRDVVLDPPVALAPMVGLSHSAMRSLIVRLGGAGLFFTEMLAAKHLPHENPLSPYIVCSSEESPLFYQIFINETECIPAALEVLHKLGADGVDINLGCPAPQVRRRGAGSFLAEDRDRVCDIVRELRARTSLPLTAKIRLGKKLDRENLQDFSKMLEDEGVDLLSVHARIHGEKFCRRPRWQWVSSVTEHVRIPVLVNGGIFSVADARKALELSGADGVMLGRGGVTQPLLFARIAREIFDCPLSIPSVSQAEIYWQFYELLVARFAPERRLGRLKQYTPYFAANYAFGHSLATKVQKSKTIEEARDIAEEFFARNVPCDCVDFSEE